ncbi:mycofactocin-coupled SDR family oxidoreductase [Rhodococcus tukisamuensis]|uniref:SDR family mycofactocin-dependent oxidoreductase n=1 Tax=Rhodococcus tukisamuensis TaxID=168276 RepID=A0A1G6ZL21_9NOCA|nr:mycofactocin-coupled SDR family oxidoreductase [Rhodococcus tukisamuensis]SDE03348.1 SDR family mycofactocin-dependent oxidoreductase [Rhodococcus tukisamuensis]
MGKLTGQVAFITGAARGQGRAHAVKMASEGADIIAVDLCAPVATAGYDMATEADLAETVALVEAQGRGIAATVADTRDLDALQKAVDAGVERFGRLDIVVANAGIAASPKLSWDLTSDEFREMMDINVTGVWQSTKVAIPHLLAGGRGGSVVLISSMAGLRGVPGIVHYSTAKHAVRGMAKSLANELAWANIRVNSVHPGNVRTTMIDNEAMVRGFRPDLEHPVLADTAAIMQKLNLLPEPWVEAEVIADAVLFLVGDTGRGITGIALPVDLGTAEKFAGG